ncbi:LacI family DNA-binding transcriptional regulator [Zobellia sp. 1_MG-2023]|uniref:LacI family DNA-binding transcriptional regulator n=1 Tax=Zobellia sp. 1_MG-2023 TaxID=3062626 RepID=UPI0026E1A534|nr:LacI family DNA-binding transcriptional regulator [Zobellia sp. 1_MG-2023]MDO6819449.1 LacI family DNA-binding transcriptional regulator [Zobellia sp. 1_MG-2023]
MKRKLSLDDIAKHFKVSKSTVSKALNDSHEISARTKAKIVAYAKEQKYRPNLNAINLRKESSQSVGVIIPNVLNYFFAQVISGVEKVLNDHGYNMIACISNESYNKEVAITEMLRKGAISGLLVSLAEETGKMDKVDHFEPFLNKGIPLVMFDRVSSKLECDKVTINDTKAAYNATEHLIKSGCKRIAVVSLLGDLEISKLRINGYHQCLKDHNIELDQSLIFEKLEKSFMEVEIRKLLSAGKVDAILGLEEEAGVTSLLTANSLGMKIPEALSIICFTNGVLPKYVRPSLTSISQHGYHMGQRAAQRLVSRIEQTQTDKAFETEVIKTTMIERDSTIPLIKA